MAVCADKRIRIGNGLTAFVLGPDSLSQIFQIDLMADAGARRHNAEILKRFLAPFQEGIALAIALIFAVHILLEGFYIAEIVDHHRVINDEINRHLGVDLGRVAAKHRGSVAHRRQIDHCGHTGEILHQHTGGPKSYLATGFVLNQPLRHCLDIICADCTAIFEAQQVFQQNLERERQAGNPGQSVFLGFHKTEIGVSLAFHGKLFARFETVERFSHRAAPFK